MAARPGGETRVLLTAPTRSRSRAPIEPVAQLTPVRCTLQMAAAVAVVEGTIEAKLHAELFASFPEDAGRSASASDAVREAARETPYDEESGEGGDHKLTYGEGEREGRRLTQRDTSYRPTTCRILHPSRRALPSTQLNHV